MSYISNCPVSGQSLGASRPIINTNFSLIQSVFDTNHVDFNLTNAGAHTHVDLVDQTSDPNPATGIVSHFSKEQSGATEWFFQRENTGTTIQMSTQYGIPVAGTSGRTFLPGGLILIWGTCNPNLAMPVTVTLQGSGFPNQCSNIQISLTDSGVTIALSLIVYDLTPTTFMLKAVNSQYLGPPFSTSAFYWAIGY